MIVGILLYTREVREVHYGVWGLVQITRVLKLIPVWQGCVLWVLGGDECWGALGVNLGEALE